MTHREEVVLVPIKDFSLAKSRLRDSLGEKEVHELSRSLAAATIAACQPRPCVVLCDSDDVAAFAAQCSAQVRRVRGGLNEAVVDGYRDAEESCERVIVVHADLARPQGLGTFDFAPGVTLVTDRHGEGTNVLVVPTRVDFRFAYGPASARRHVDEAHRLELPVTVITTSPWGLDIDVPEDLRVRDQMK